MDKSKLTEAGLKATLPRMRILNFLATTDEHLSAEDIFHRLQQAGEEVPLATVYRVLDQLEKAGLVLSHNFEEGRRVYELCEEEHHDHLVCVKCRKVIEFQNQVIEEHQENIAEKNNFKMTDHSLIIYGLCEDCQ